MAATKVYEWERKTFPWHQKIWIKPDHRIALTRALAKHWGIGLGGTVTMVTRGGGHAIYDSVQFSFLRDSIKLPKEEYRCSLALILHELAHHYNHQKLKGDNHGAKFKQSVIKLFIEVRVMKLLPPIFAMLREKDAKRREKRAKDLEAMNRRIAIRQKRDEDEKRLRGTEAYMKEQFKKKSDRIKKRVFKLRTRSAGLPPLSRRLTDRWRP